MYVENLCTLCQYNACRLPEKYHKFKKMVSFGIQTRLVYRPTMEISAVMLKTNKSYICIRKNDKVTVLEKRMHICRKC